MDNSTCLLTLRFKARIEWLNPTRHNFLFMISTINHPKKRLIVYNIILLIATTVHHVYGGVIYQTSWRITGSLVGIVYCVLVALLIIYSDNNNLFRVLAITLSLMWLLAIGIYEGGYNHVVKNLLFLSGASAGTLERFFPPEFGYKIPDNLFFEITGVLQFVIVLLGWKAYKPWK